MNPDNYELFATIEKKVMTENTNAALSPKNARPPK